MSVIRVLVQHPDGSAARKGRLFVMTVAAISAAVLILATYGRTWSWSGFQGNENVWEWFQLLAQPIAIVGLLVQLVSPLDPKRWLLVFGLFLTGLAVLLVGGYAGHWQWTGFGEYRMWDWLHLLVLPVMLALLPLWLRAGDDLSRGVQLALAAFVGALAVVVVAGYAFNWSWTGCLGKTVRDWLNLLMTPLVLVTCKWFVASHVRSEAVAEPIR